MDNAKIFECSKELVYAIIEEAKNRGEDVDPVALATVHATVDTLYAVMENDFNPRSAKTARHTEEFAKAFYHQAMVTAYNNTMAEEWQA